MNRKTYTWLMLFNDWIRIDLHLDTKEVALERYLSDCLTVKLLDKDCFLPELEQPDDCSHWIK